MAKVKTTRYYLNIFGSVQKKMTQVTGDPKAPTKDDVFQYDFANDGDFFDHFRKLNIKTIQGKLEKGNTLVGVYERKGAERDRPRPRINSEKFKEKKKEFGK
jgi:hypothetical protein